MFTSDQIFFCASMGALYLEPTMIKEIIDLVSEIEADLPGVNETLRTKGLPPLDRDSFLSYVICGVTQLRMARDLYMGFPVGRDLLAILDRIKTPDNDIKDKLKEVEKALKDLGIDRDKNGAKA